MSSLPAEYLTASELADLLRIKQRKVYELAAAGSVPCSRVTGKLLFPRRAVEAWVAAHSDGPETAAPAKRQELFLGSHDPLLEWALRESGSTLATRFGGSLDGLDEFAAGAGVVTGLHLFDAASDGWNVPAVRRRFAGDPVVLVEFAWRERGLLTAQGVAASIAGMADLRGRRVVFRQSAAGSQALFEQLLAAAGVPLAAVEATVTARSENDVAIALLDGKADAALGLSGVAQQYQLGFVPLVRERFDLLVDRRSWFEPPLQRFITFCGTEPFRVRAREMQGYDVDGFGTVHFNGR